MGTNEKKMAIKKILIIFIATLLLSRYFFAL